MEYQAFKVHHGTWMKEHLQALFIRFLVGILGLLLLAVLSSGCSKEKSGNSVSAPIPVTVGTAIQKTVPVQLRATGISRGMLRRNKEIRDKFL